MNIPEENEDIYICHSTVHSKEQFSKLLKYEIPSGLIFMVYTEFIYIYFFVFNAYFFHVTDM